MKFAKIDASASGDNAIVAAVAGKRIRVIGYTIIAGAAVTAKWRSATTDISGGMALAANGGAAPSVSVLSPGGMFGVLQTEPGEALNLNLSDAVAVGGHLVYIEVLV